MNAQQQLWWQQSESDHEILVLLRANSALPCHQLHYLQMITEKLAKAYLWRSGSAPPKTHRGFVQFMRALGSVPLPRQANVANALGFANYNGVQTWVRNSLPLIYELESIAPALGNDGPNPEYPWPHDAPIAAPVGHTFAIWGRLTNTGRGRQLVQVIQRAVANFGRYA